MLEVDRKEEKGWGRVEETGNHKIAKDKLQNLISKNKENNLKVPLLSFLADSHCGVLWCYTLPTLASKVQITGTLPSFPEVEGDNYKLSMVVTKGNFWRPHKACG